MSFIGMETVEHPVVGDGRIWFHAKTDCFELVEFLKIERPDEPKKKTNAYSHSGRSTLLLVFLMFLLYDIHCEVIRKR